MPGWTEPQASDPPGGGAPEPTLVDVSVGPLAGAVLSRVAGAMAAQAGLRLDRLADATLIAEALVAHGTRHAQDGRLLTAITAEPGRLSLRLGPLMPGGGERLRRDATLPEVGSVLERLADEVVVEPGGAGDFVVLRIGTDSA
ncbi:MAG: hypothetical protein AB1416_10515 [Actinomycetota bacterium]